MKALVLSGGGSHGAYQVGALRLLLGRLSTRYDIITGISVGALNGAFLAQYAQGEEYEAQVGLETLWLGLTTESIYKNWWLPYVAALWKTSVFDSAPLANIVKTRLNVARVKASGKQLRIGAVGLSTGTYRVFDQNYASLQEAVIASSAFPVMFTPASLEGQLWSDGGLANITPLGEAIDAGATDIDILQCSPIYDGTNFSGKTLQVAERALGLMCDAITDNDLKLCEVYNQLVATGTATDRRHINYRLIRPEPGLSPSSLDFSQAAIRLMMTQGFTDACHIVGLTESLNGFK
jgi:NTE family protein